MHSAYHQIHSQHVVLQHAHDQEMWQHGHDYIDPVYDLFADSSDGYDDSGCDDAAVAVASGGDALPSGGAASSSGSAAAPPVPPPPPVFGPGNAAARGQADVVVHLHGFGKISYYRRYRRYEAVCTLHGCRLTKSSDASAVGRPSKGRPLGFMALWLKKTGRVQREGGAPQPVRLCYVGHHDGREASGAGVFKVPPRRGGTVRH